MSTLEQIESTISRLPRKLQKQVVERLNARLWPTGFDPAVENHWAETVKHRLSDMDSGHVKRIPAARVFFPSRRAATGSLKQAAGLIRKKSNYPQSTARPKA